MNIIVGDKIYVDNPTKDLLEWCEKELVVSNPKYDTLVKLGKEDQIRRYHISPEMNLYTKGWMEVSFDSGLMYGIKPFIKGCKIETYFNDNGIVMEQSKEPSQPLFDYQEEAVDKMLQAKSGVCVCSAGGGKTQIGLSLAHKIGHSTLWLTHTTDLLNQSKARFIKLFPNDANAIGTITDGKVDIGGKITFATIQTMASLDPDIYRKKFDTVMCDECFDGNTEILTEKGFIKLKDLKEGIKVAQYENGKTNFVNPIRYIKRKAENYISFKNNDIVINTTENHNMVVEEKGVEKVIQAKDVKSGYFITTSTIDENKKQELTWLDRVKIMIQADGCLYHHSKKGIDTFKFEFSKERKIKRFKFLCEQAGIEYKEYGKRTFLNKKWKESSKFTIKLDSEVDNYKKLSNFLEMPKNSKYAKDILDEISYWDAYTLGKKIEYDSIVKENVDFIQICCLLSGTLSSKINKYIKKDNYHSDNYRIYYNKTNRYNFKSFEKKIINEPMMVYCVEVPSRKIIVRKNGFAFVCGNCHHVSASPTLLKMFGKVISKIPARYKYGFTATPFRQDGMVKSMYALLGLSTSGTFEPVWTITKDKTNTLTAEMEKVPLNTKFSFEMLNEDGTFNYNKLLSYLANDLERNNTIIQNVKKMCSVGRKQLILSQRVEHCQKLCELLKEEGINAELLIGKVSAKKRSEILNNTDDWQVVVATVSLAKEGLDIPKLDTLHLVTPLTNKTDVIQSVGRIERVCKDKQSPIVLDYEDTKIPYCVSKIKKHIGFLKSR